MAEDGMAILEEMKELYENLASDLPCKLVMITPVPSVQAPPESIDYLDLQNLVLVNDAGDQEALEARGISVFGKNVFNVWSGVLDADVDGTPLARSSVIISKLKSAMLPSGGFLYGDELYQIESFYRWIIIGNPGVPQGWIIVAKGKRFDTM